MGRASRRKKERREARERGIHGVRTDALQCDMVGLDEAALVDMEALINATSPDSIRAPDALILGRGIMDCMLAMPYSGEGSS